MSIENNAGKNRQFSDVDEKIGTNEIYKSQSKKTVLIDYMYRRPPTAGCYLCYEMCTSFLKSCMYIVYRDSKLDSCQIKHFIYIS